MLLRPLAVDSKGKSVARGDRGFVVACTATAVKTAGSLVVLLELHPGVDEDVLALEEQEGLQGVHDLFKIAPKHTHL